MVLRKIKKSLSKKQKSSSENNNIEIINFGCRLNIYEGEIIRKLAGKAGLRNAAIFNTCAVTNEAERQVRQAIRKYSKEHPDMNIIVTGCSAQISFENLSKLSVVKKILGNREKLKESEYRKIAEQLYQDRISVSEIGKPHKYEYQFVDKIADHTKGFVQIQQGCNNRCAYCIVPFTRGRAFSFEVNDILKQVQMLTDNGYLDITLTGIDIASYGIDLQDKKKDFSYVIGEILKHNRALKRLRLSSLDPAKDFSTLFNIFKNDERLLPYFHLSMQSGDDNVLKIMRRRHRRKHLIDFVEKARKINPDVSIGADIICGFPGETNLMFENTYNIIRDLKISHLHVFPYSNRPGTAAEKYTGQVRGEIIKRRARKLRELGDNNFKEHMNAQVGKYDEVLVETSGNKGHTRNYIEAIINEKLPSNKIIKVKLTGTKGKKLIGEMVS